MKNLLSILAALFLMSNASFATIRTVSNHPLGGSQYTTLDAAYTAAVNGDTLLFEGTNLIYNRNGSWAKTLVVIGQGINTSKTNFKKTIINGQASFPFALANAGSGSKFYGIHFTNGIEITGNVIVSNLTFEDCLIENGATAGFNLVSGNSTGGVNNVFRNCVFNADNGQNVRLASTGTAIFTFLNCIFDGYINGLNNGNNTVLVDRCLFLRSNGESLIDILIPSVTNSIFMNYTSVANAGTVGGTFFNNIARLSATLPPAGNSGSSNLSSTDPNFVTYTLGAFYSTAHDYHLQAGSPAIGTGTDASDIGLHGGASKFDETGEALIAPVMRDMQITNISVSPNGTMNVNISASKPNDN